jgi:NitT/TauT family transport system ATP-binding protein
VASRAEPVTDVGVRPAPGGPPAKVAARGVTIEYESPRTLETVCAVDGLEFDVAEGEFVAIVGPSGCGKSSFLNAVAGLVPYSGELLVDGRSVQAPSRRTSVVFQHASLLPWRNVLRNVSYGLEMHGAGKAEALGRAHEMIELVGLVGREQAYPHELSGGMQQRVNLARALASDPQIILFDEPLAALDAQTREEMQVEILRLWQETKQTSILVTHQIDEAVLLADRVVVMSRGPAGRVKEIVDVPLARPRSEDSMRQAAAGELISQIASLIRAERSAGSAGKRPES